VEHPAEVVSLLRSVRLTGLDRVSVRNLTTSAPGYGFQLEPDGSFRASVPVSPGANVIEVTAEIEGREPLRVRRQVTVYEGDAALEPLAPVVPEERAPPARETRERRSLQLEVQPEAQAGPLPSTDDEN
jgi:hypothetical protein